MTDSAARINDREWLERGAALNPDGFEQIYIDAFGIEGALDLIAVQGGRVWEVNLTRRPFSSNTDLKFAVYDAREHQSIASQMAHTLGFETMVMVRRDREEAKAQSEVEGSADG